MRQPGAPRARRVPVQPDAQIAGCNGFTYADAFEIGLRQPDQRSAEEWVRSAMEQAPWPVRWTVSIAHRHVLRLHLAPASAPGHMLGWKVVASRPDAVQLEAVSPLLGRGVIVGRRVDPTHTLVTTFVSARSPLGRVVWAVVAPLHRRVARYLLERAA